MPLVRERPGLVRVLVEDRQRWHVIDPSLAPTEASTAVADLRHAASATDVGRLRRVLRWTPLFVFAAVTAVGLVGVTAVLSAIDLRETLAQGAVVVVLMILVLVAAGAAAFLAYGRSTPDLVQVVPSTRVVRVPRRVLRQVTEETPVADVWRIVQAVALVDELRAARWVVEDGLADADADADAGASADATGVEEEQAASSMSLRGGEPDSRHGLTVDRRVVALLRAAEADAVADLAEVASATGYVPSRGQRRVDS